MQIATHHRVRHPKHKLAEQDTSWKRFITAAAYFAGILGPLFTIDQVYRVWIEQNVAGVSLIAWGSCFFFSIIWTAYGVTYKEKTVIVTNSLWVLINGLVAVGVWWHQ